jgi:hypothetical protein
MCSSYAGLEPRTHCYPSTLHYTQRWASTRFDAPPQWRQARCFVLGESAHTCISYFTLSYTLALVLLCFVRILIMPLCSPQCLARSLTAHPTTACLLVDSPVIAAGVFDVLGTSYMGLLTDINDRLIHDEELQGRPLVLHLFSNGGAFALECLSGISQCLSHSHLLLYAHPPSNY